jgi:hypothetical protein
MKVSKYGVIRVDTCRSNSYEIQEFFDSAELADEYVRSKEIKHGVSYNIEKIDVLVDGDSVSLTYAGFA